MKICKKCKIEKELTEFNKRSTSADGLRSSCRECDRLYQQANKEKLKAIWKAYYQVNRSKILKKTKEYREQNPEVVKHMKAYRKAWTKLNKEKIDAQNKNYREINKEKIKERNRIYTKKNKSKILNITRSYQEKKKNNNFIKTELQKFVAQEMYDLAQIRKNETGIDWHIDHIKPLSKGGKHAINNLQVVPAMWNLSKGNSNNAVFKLSDWI